MAMLELPDYGVLKPDERRALQPTMEQIFGSMFDQAVAVRNRWQVWWFIIMSYLQGARSIAGMDFNNGSVEINDADETDEFVGDNDSLVPFRWDEVMSKRQIEIGRLLRLDCGPSAKKRTMSLQSLRAAATTQVLLDSLLSGTDFETDIPEAMSLLVDYGTVGLLHLRNEFEPIASSSGLTYGREIIPPWELLGIPGEIRTSCENRADARLRWYPLKQLEKWTGLWWPKDSEAGLLDVQDLVYGDPTTRLRAMMGTNSASVGNVGRLWDETNAQNALMKWKKRQSGKYEDGRSLLTSEPFVELRELFVKGPRHSIVRYIVMAGRWILFDQSFKPGTVPNPLSKSNYDDVGQYYGRSFTGRILPAGLRQERLIHRLLTNTSDFSKFGFLLTPTGMGIDFENFKETGDPRIIGYESDPTARRDPIQQITPVNSSDIPGRVAAMIGEGLDRLSLQGPLFEGRSMGRMESGESYRTVAQTGSTHLLTTARSIRSMLSQHYRSMLYASLEQIRANPDGIRLELTRVENSVAGIRMDPATGQVILDKAGIDPWDVELSIRSDDPVQSDTERDMAYRMYLDRTIKPLEFIILNYMKNWGYPIGSRGVYENYCKAVLQNIRLFNDGETPGRDIGYFPGTFDLPEVFLFATEEFCRSVEFDLSSDNIKMAFASRIQKLKAQQSGMLPPGMMTPDMAAAASKALPQMQGGMQNPMMGMGAGGPPMSGDAGAALEMTGG